MLDVADDPDDGCPGRRISVADVLADGVFAGPVLPRKDLIDEGHRLGVRAVQVAEDAALPDGDLEGGKIIRADDADIAVRSGISGRGRPALNPERRGAGVSAERQRHSGGHRGDSGGGGQVAENRAREGDLLRVVVVAGRGQRDAGGDHALRLESRVDFFERGQTPQEQARAH